MGTVLIYLNGVARGGATAFPELGLSIAPEEGLAVVFFPCTAGGAGGARGGPGRQPSPPVPIARRPAGPQGAPRGNRGPRRKVGLAGLAAGGGVLRPLALHLRPHSRSSSGSSMAEHSAVAAGRSACTSNARVEGVACSCAC